MRIPSNPPALARSAACHQLSFWADWQRWLLMVVAMMLPLMLPSVRWTAERSFRARERRAMAGYLLGYLAPWAILGVGVAALLGRVDEVKRDVTSDEWELSSRLHVDDGTSKRAVTGTVVPVKLTLPVQPAGPARW